MIKYVATYNNSNSLQAELFEEKSKLQNWLEDIADKRNMDFDTIRIFYVLSESGAEAKVSVKIKLKGLKEKENTPTKITQPEVNFKAS